jgi:hypothetical protein
VSDAPSEKARDAAAPAPSRIAHDVAPNAGSSRARFARYRVELVPDVAVTVRVVDDRGEPCAAFPVGLAALDAANTDAVLNVSDVALAFTDAKGLATIPHLQSRCATGPEASGSAFSSRRWRWGRARAPEGAAPPKPVWHVRALLVGSRDKGVAFDHAAPPTEPLELRLPPTGRLRVRAESGGKQVTSFRMAYASRAHAEGEEWSPLDRGAQAKPEADGWARFPHVALGLRFDLYADAEGGMRGAHAGPTAAGQEVDAVLRSADDRIFVAGRLLTPERTPAHNVRISVRASCRGRPLSRALRKLEASARVEGVTPALSGISRFSTEPSSPTKTASA